MEDKYKLYMLGFCDALVYKKKYLTYLKHHRKHFERHRPYLLCKLDNIKLPLKNTTVNHIECFTKC